MRVPKNKLLDKISADLLSVSPLIHRGLRRKLVMTTLANANLPITPLHIEIMRLLSESGELPITRIGEALNITKAQMTHLINRLSEMEIVERRAGVSDRRIVNIALTQKGKELIRSHDSKLRAAARETLSCLSQEELENLATALESIQKILSKTL
ncbi:MAG: MarR family transcriptional regulator [Dehalococcoidales bacterium]|jgi:DNA-binding MarR family transcriptional regulator|nr:MarR family transcriptional regulator [Dehalococcoidales bacterium]MDX9986361.1 MarR family transcriptional regulator [Dehalococcoidales bacterium]NLE89453.1 MarR family transcriptional regulator [Dehalococcoidales bacterium]